MSTSNESDRETGAEELDLELPPEWRASPATYEHSVAVMLIPKEWEARVAAVLEWAADEAWFAKDLPDLLEADADVAVVSYPLVDVEPDEHKMALRRVWMRRAGPIWLVIDAPPPERGACMTAGADIAVGGEFDERELGVMLATLLERVRVERDRSPLTGLPGNRWLVRYLEEMLRDDRELGVLLLDIDDFKRYNDRCGHLRGDAAILALALAASQAAALHGSFATHVGGDDLCVVCTPEVLDDVAGACLSAFEIQARALADRELTITLAGTVVSPADADALEQVFERLAHLKTQGKLRPGSNYVRT